MCVNQNHMKHILNTPYMNLESILGSFRLQWDQLLDNKHWFCVRNNELLFEIISVGLLTIDLCQSTVSIRSRTQLRLIDWLLAFMLRNFHLTISARFILTADLSFQWIFVKPFNDYWRTERYLSDSWYVPLCGKLTSAMTQTNSDE